MWIELDWSQLDWTEVVWTELEWSKEYLNELKGTGLNRI